MERKKELQALTEELTESRRFSALVPTAFEVEQRVRADGRLWCLVR